MDTDNVKRESEEMLESFKESFSIDHVKGIEKYLSRIKTVKKEMENRGKGEQARKKLKHIATNCLNNGKCANWLSIVKNIDFNRLKKPSTPDGYCFHANAQALTSLISKISDPSASDFWGNVAAAHTASQNLKKYYEDGGVQF